MVINIRTLDTKWCPIVEECECDRYSVSPYGVLTLYKGQGLNERVWMVYKEYWKFEVVHKE